MRRCTKHVRPPAPAHPALQLYKEICGLLAAGDKTALRQLVRALLCALALHGLVRALRGAPACGFCALEMRCHVPCILAIAR